MLESLYLYFIPESLRTDADVFRRARLTITIALTLVGLSMINFVQSLLMIGFSVISGLMIGAVVAAGATPFVLRASKSVRLVGNILAFTYTVVIFSISYFVNQGFQGGIAQYFFLATPLIAALANGIRSAWIWMGVSMVITITLYVANLFHYPFPPPPAAAATATPEYLSQQRLVGLVMLFMLITSLVVQFLRAKDEALATVAETRAASERKAQEDYHRLEELKAESERRAAEDLRRIEAQREYLAQSVETMLQVVGKVAQGDLTARLPNGNNDDIGRLYDGINLTTENLQRALISVSQATDRTVEAVNTITVAVEQLAAGANSQAAQASQVATSVEEMSRTIEQTTQQTSSAAHEASLANDDAHLGGTTMQTMIENVRRMAEIVVTSAEKIGALGKSSEQIGEIVQVIYEIADQTNLLALNAAIEAARAGDAGRGFAVVADEVRKLAERTQKATKEISTMVKNIQSETTVAVKTMEEGTEIVKNGRESAGQTSTVLEKIIERTGHVSDIMSQLAAASEQQATTSNQMAQNVSMISTTVEQSAGGVANIAHTAEDLQHQAEELQLLMGQFEIGLTSAARLPHAQARRLTGKRPPSLSA